jgi:hypothetical protein
MAFLARFSAVGLPDQTVVTTSTQGAGDTPFNAVAGAFRVDTSGGRPRIRVNQATGTAAYLAWDTAMGGERTVYALRTYCEWTAFPSASAALLSAYSAAGQQWRITLSGTGGGAPGQVRMLSGAGAQVGSSGATLLATGTRYRIEVATSAGSLSVAAYAGDASSPLLEFSRVVGGPADSVRFGNVAASPTWPEFHLDSLALADTATYIGPSGTTPPPAGSWSLWDGVAEVPLTMSGLWDGTTVVPAVYDHTL